jgi:hypothetical protein
VEQGEKLQAVHHRHPHVNHQQVDLVLVNQPQSVGGVGRHEDVPGALRQFEHQVPDHLKETRVVIDK